jgi:hypothetical protein
MRGSRGRGVRVEAAQRAIPLALALADPDPHP